MKKTKIYCEDFHLGHLMGGVCSFACFRTLPSTAAVIVMQYFFKTLCRFLQYKIFVVVAVVVVEKTRLDGIYL